MDSVSLPDPQSLEQSGTPLFSGEFRFCLKHQVSPVLRGKCIHVSTNIFSLFYTDDTLSEPPSTNEEPSIREPVPEGETTNGYRAGNFPLGATERGKTSLVGSQGFTYNIHSRRPYATYWQCTMRLKGNPCKASATERYGIFQAGKSAHNLTMQWRWELLPRPK